MRVPFLVIFAAVLFLASGPLYSNELTVSSISFGFLTNRSNDRSFDYLETILPNTLANTLKNKYKFRIQKPYQVQERLKGFDKDLEKQYQPYQVPDLLDMLKTDYFLYGDFTILPNNQIEIVINFYRGGSNLVFSFTNVGRMEAEIFKLTDRIVGILINHMSTDKYYKSYAVKKNLPVGVITNIDGSDLNYIYYSLASAGYPVHAVQGTTVYNNTDPQIMKNFEYIHTKRTSYDTVTDRKKMRFLYGTWTGKRYDEQIAYIRKIYKIYDLNYEKTKEGILDKIAEAYKINYLFIITFNEGKSEASVRCIDLKDNEMIWMQSNIKGGDVESVMKNIISKMDKFYEAPVK